MADDSKRVKFRFISKNMTHRLKRNTVSSSSVKKYTGKSV